jgi:hypothetical protein
MNIKGVKRLLENPVVGSHLGFALRAILIPLKTALFR